MTEHAEPFRIASATVPIEPDTSGLSRVARIIARHLTAMADELDGVSEADYPFVGEELGAGDEVSPFMADLEPCPEECEAHRIHVRGPGGRLYPFTTTPQCPDGCDYPFPHEHTGEAIVTPPPSSFLAPGGNIAAGTASGAVAFGISEPECPE